MKIESNSTGHHRDLRVRSRRDRTAGGWPAWACGIIAIGVFLRVAQFACGRSLWDDEAKLALNILQRPFGGLFQPLQYHQGAPIGFLLLEKLATTFAGNSEIALRAIPFVTGIVALFVFYDVAKLYLSPGAVPLALILFSLSRNLVYYSSEVKQYSTDVLVTLILLRAVFKLSTTPLSQRELFAVGALGALAIWFSHPASFVLAGSAVVLIVAKLVHRDKEGLGPMTWVFVAWAASFLTCYMVSLRPLSRDDELSNYWRGNFAPHALSLIVPWLSYNFFAAFENPAPLNSILGAAFFVAGCGQLLRHNRLRCGLLTAPLLALFLASLLHLYPLYGRLLLFLCPILLLLVSEGAVWAYNATHRFSPIFGVAAIALLLAKPLYQAADTLIHPLRPNDIKVGIRDIESHQRLGDRWYVYYGGKYQLSYYAAVYSLSMANVRVGSDCGTDRACYGRDLSELKGRPRTWVLLSHILPCDGGDEGTILVDQLDKIGTRLEAFEASGVKVYLYDLDHPVPVAAK